MEEEKSKNQVLIIVLIVFIIISLVLGGFIVYDKILNKNNTSHSNDLLENENTPTNNKSNEIEKIEVNLTSEQAFKMIESKRKNLNYDTWSTLNAKVLKKGDNNYYWVTYTAANIDDYNSSLGVIFHYENGEWKFEIPGFSGTTEDKMSKYNFVDINQGLKQS